MPPLNMGGHCPPQIVTRHRDSRANRFSSTEYGQRKRQ